MKNALVLVASLFLIASSAVAQTAGPRIFFTDIKGGPNTGGEDVGGFSGAYVTIYGNNFGSSQGSSTITLNGANCLRVVSWGAPHLWYQKIVVQMGGSCASGNFVITVGGQVSTAATITVNGAVENPAAFTVRAGNIRCISTTGSDGNSGAFGSCWATLPKAVHTIASGDIAYVMNGVFASAQDSSNPISAAIGVNSTGGANYKAIVAYPGASAGINTSQGWGIRIPAGGYTNWVFAGLSITANNSAILAGNGGHRLIANTMACPNGNGASACAELINGFYMHGNKVDPAGRVGATKLYHAVYFSFEANHVDFGWNEVANARGCRGLQFHDDGGPDMTDLHVHDNYIHDTVCDGVNFSTVDTDAGTVEAFNNVLYNVGKGPSPPDGSAVYSCFKVTSASGNTAPVQIYNNTCVNAGASNTGDASTTGALALSVPTLIRNNIFYQANAQNYLISAAGCNGIASGSTNNNWFGDGAPPTCAGFTNNLNVNPGLVSLGSDFRLQAGSPMINAGVLIAGLAADRDGVPRPQGSTLDIGAHESCAVPPPAVNEGGVVNNASYESPLAPGSISAVFGINFTRCGVTLIANFGSDGRLVTSLGGAEVLVDGILTPLFYVTPIQLGVQIPVEMAGRPAATLQVKVAGETSVSRTISLDAGAPGIFTFNQNGAGPGTFTHSNGIVVSQQNPARPNEVIVMYATGLGLLTPPLGTGVRSTGNLTAIPATVTVDGVPAEVSFSGSTPGLVGLNQINFRIPPNTRTAASIPVVLSIGGRQSNVVTINIGP